MKNNGVYKKEKKKKLRIKLKENNTKKNKDTIQ